MTLCVKDLYLIFLTIIIFYLLYCNVCNKEKFDITTADTPAIKTLINEVYRADIEAIRNLSSIATKLTLSGSLTIPGNTQHDGDLTVQKMLCIGKSSDNGRNTYFQYPDGQNYIRGNTFQDGNFQITGTNTIKGNTQHDGNSTITGNLVVNGTISIGVGDTLYTFAPGNDGLRIATGNANDSQRHWFKKNPGQRNYN